MSDQVTNWRNLQVRRPRSFNNLVEAFCNSEHAIFSHIRDLMVFAAMIGYSRDQFAAIEPGADTIPITMHVYSNNRTDTYIYLLSLLKAKDASILKNNSLTDAIKIFEGYCNGGLQLMQDWLDDNHGDPIGIDTLYLQLLRTIADLETCDISNPSEVEF